VEKLQTMKNPDISAYIFYRPSFVERNEAAAAPIFMYLPIFQFMTTRKMWVFDLSLRHPNNYNIDFFNREMKESNSAQFV